ncbi:MAG: cytochrome c [Candidatus Aminicenantes bacterium]|nr:cytochrome c [Candidatus Aminicenantes bacterium]
MKKRSVFGVALLAFFMMTALPVSIPSQQKERPGEEQAAMKPGECPPAALDALYPPKAQGPVFLLKMISLAESFGGFLGDLFENDVPNALASFQKFKAQYLELSSLVPEWKALYPSAPLEELAASLKTGDQGGVMAAVEKVGTVCTACHVEHMARVQFRYGWPEFSEIKAKDPLTGEIVGLDRLMLFLDVNFSGIGADLEQGQAENAQKQFQGFKARFEAMAGTCQECHGQDERKYYVDGSVRAMVEDLGKAAAESSPEKAGKLVMGIGMESCHKCHLVHIPAAFAQKKGRR